MLSIITMALCLLWGVVTAAAGMNVMSGQMTLEQHGVYWGGLLAIALHAAR